MNRAGNRRAWRRSHPRGAHGHAQTRATGAFWGLVSILLWLPAPAHAISSALCKDDKVTEVPPFAASRDANSCLLIDPGNGDPPVKFQYEEYHKKGVAGTTGYQGGTPGVDRIDEDGFDDSTQDRCRTSATESCSYLIWDVTADNYLHPEAKNEDGFRVGYYAQYYWIKDSEILNQWKCDGGNWSGPNGIGCGGEDSTAHADGIQNRAIPERGGWFIMQDSSLVNTGHLAHLIQVTPEHGPAGSFLFQGVRVARINTPMGEADHWIDDCIKRGTENCQPDQTTVRIGKPAPEVWIINGTGNILHSGFDNHEKVVVVNTGCNASGCNGTIGYNNGWPHPLNAPDSGPGTCPNGLVKQSLGSGVKSVFCYTSIEKALNDTVTQTSNQGDCPAPYCPHARPPFLQHSASGWANPPSTATTAPAPPVLLQ